MLPRATKSNYAVVGVVPELHYVLLRDTADGTLEAWTESRGQTLRAVVIQGKEFEFVRELKAYRIPDTDYNRRNCPNEIGKIYVDSRPLGVEVREL